MHRACHGMRNDFFQALQKAFYCNARIYRRLFRDMLRYLVFAPAARYAFPVHLCDYLLVCPRYRNPCIQRAKTDR